MELLPVLQRIAANGIEMECAMAGPETGPKVLLIHGLGWDATRLWSGTLSAFAAAGFRAVAPNLRGVGGTEATEAPYSTGLYAQDLDALLDGLGIARCAVVGFSMGASVVAAMLAGPRADRIGPVVLACGGLPGSAEGAAATEAMLARAQTLGPAAFAAEQAAEVFRPAWAAAHPEAVTDFRRWRAAMDQNALFRAFRSGYGVDLSRVVPAADRPTLVIAADEDAFCPLEDMRRMAEAIPGARFDVIEESGHMAPVEQPAAFEAALRQFLDAEWKAGQCPTA
ncbi:MAG: alpha/beta fold hydrolase [Pseudomonadota bacterium]